MWFWLIALIDIFLFLFLPWYAGIPYWLHLPSVAFFWLWVPKEQLRFRKFRWWQDLFDVQLSEELPKSQQCIYAVYPHGVFSVSIAAAFAVNPNMLHVKPVGSSVLFLLPFIKEVVGLVGTIPATRKDMIAALQCGDSLAMCPGGIRELPGLDPERISKGKGFVRRLGFIRIAMSVNVPIVPVWAEGEEELYDVWLWSPTVQSILLSLFYYPGFVVSWGRPWLRFWPKPRPLRLRVGKPIQPTDLTEEKLAEIFYEALTELKNK